MMNFNTYLSKTHAAWLGKLIGIRLGAPLENWTHQQIKDTYGKLTRYPVDYGLFAADDDSNGPLFFARCLLDDCSEDIDVELMANNLVNVMSQKSGFFWWGGVGISTEDTAYHNLVNGISAPKSGSVAQNGEELAQQIGGQIFSDCWGYVSAGNPHVAKKLAQKMSSVTHDLAGIDGGVFVAVCISLAYTMSDCRELIMEACQFLNEGIYKKTVLDILRFYDEGNSQEECLDYIFKVYNYDLYGGVCHIIPNTAIMIMAMLYGENDFSKTLCMLCEAGWDTDCTCGNVGSIMGALVGIEQIESHWIYPIHDTLLSSSIFGSLNLDTVTNTTKWFVSLGCNLNGIEMPEAFSRQFEASYELYQFDLPYSTQGLMLNQHRYSETNFIQENDYLKCIINQGFKGHCAQLTKKTYLESDDVYDARYQPSFSPIFYSGETVSMIVENPKQLNVKFSLYAKTIDGVCVQSDWEVVKDKKELSFKVSGLEESVISEVGLLCEYQERIMHEYFLVHEMKLSRDYDVEIKWNEQKMAYWGLDFGETPWGQIQQCTSWKNNSYTNEDGLWISDDMILFMDAKASVQEAEFEFDLKDSENLTFCLDVRGVNRYLGLKVSKDYLEVFHKNEKDKIALSKKVEIRLKSSKNQLIFTRKNALITIAINQDLFEFNDSMNEQSFGAVGIKVDEKKACLVHRCHLRSCNLHGSRIYFGRRKK